MISLMVLMLASLLMSASTDSAIVNLGSDSWHEREQASEFLVLVADDSLIKKLQEKATATKDLEVKHRIEVVLDRYARTHWVEPQPFWHQYLPNKRFRQGGCP